MPSLTHGGGGSSGWEGPLTAFGFGWTGRAFGSGILSMNAKTAGVDRLDALTCIHLTHCVQLI